LHVLLLQNNVIEALPDELFSCLPNLIELNVSNNRLQSLSPRIGALTFLRELRIANNTLRQVPPSIALLDRLHTLDLSKNQLEFVPYEMTRLPRLSKFWVQGNRF
ncbi:uncharacterized protein BJ171DRAFT_394375, partial [Polychytrium aggregatum]|uniref:uncharacterized protein n=1 Tax=Polychytrium aggregatum TaxID=110093 RepID=UPI0022FDED55